jgi:F0F1-type ATP synthase membrane subunit c/vacuolar-type H+-ATPase subunit K
MTLSGFLFLFILATFLTSGAFFYKYGDVDSDDRIKKIYKNPNKFKISIVLILISSVSVIALTVLLFIVFSPYNVMLGVVWTIFRLGEGLILIYNEKTSWGLINIARQYSGLIGDEKNSLSKLGRTVFQTLNYRFYLSQFLFGVGTLAYSIVFVTYGAVPEIIGWLGLVVGILVSFANATKLSKHNFKALEIFGALSAILFEVIFGGWLLFSSII